MLKNEKFFTTEIPDGNILHIIPTFPDQKKEDEPNKRDLYFTVVSYIDGEAHTAYDRKYTLNEMLDLLSNFTDVEIKAANDGFAYRVNAEIDEKVSA